MFKKAVLAAGILCALSSGAQAAASFTFDPNGDGIGGITDVTTFDWLPGNALAVGGNPSGGLATNDTVRLLYQSNLGTLTDGTTPLFLNNGGSGFYFTAVAAFNETATVTNGGLNASFTMAPGDSVFRIYANTTALGNNLAGTGFTAGTVILEGTLTSVTSSNFTATTAAPQLLDQFGGDNYGGTQSIVGSGSTDLVWRITSFDAGFFPTLTLNTIITTAINSSLIVPFKEVNPSALFSDIDTTTNTITTVAHNIGSCNGCPQGAADLNFQFQADANSSLTVPEPGSLALLGIALSGFGALRLRRSRTAA